MKYNFIYVLIFGYSSIYSSVLNLDLFIEKQDLVPIAQILNKLDINKLEQLFDDKELDLENLRTKNGCNLLHITSILGFTGLTSYLLKKAPFLTTQLSDDGISVLHFACFFNYIDIAKMLIKQDENLLYLAYNNGLTVLHIACYKGHLKMAELILDTDLELAYKFNHDMVTPLHYACLKKHARIVKLLLQRANSLIIYLTPNGETGLDIAIKLNDIETITTILLNYKSA